MLKEERRTRPIRFIEKDYDGNTVLDLNLDDIPAFVESNPEHMAADLMLALFKIETELKYL